VSWSCPGGGGAPPPSCPMRLRMSTVGGGARGRRGQRCSPSNRSSDSLVLESEGKSCKLKEGREKRRQDHSLHSFSSHTHSAHSHATGTMLGGSKKDRRQRPYLPLSFPVHLSSSSHPRLISFPSQQLNAPPPLRSSPTPSTSLVASSATSTISNVPTTPNRRLVRPPTEKGTTMRRALPHSTTRRMLPVRLCLDFERNGG
jgi:hypothetical protein